jgi:hypothetical protein
MCQKLETIHMKQIYKHKQQTFVNEQLQIIVRIIAKNKNNRRISVENFHFTFRLLRQKSYEDFFPICSLQKMYFYFYLTFYR